MSNAPLLPAAIMSLLLACSCTPANDAAPVDPATPAAEAPADPATADAPPAPAGRTLREMDAQLVKASAQMAVVTRKCEFATAAKTDEARRQAREEFVARGVDRAEFDRAYDAAYEASVAKWDQGTAGEREQACSSVRQIGAQMARDLPSEAELQRMQAQMQDRLDALKQEQPAQ